MKKFFLLLFIIINFFFQIQSKTCKDMIEYYLAKFNPLDALNPFTSTGLGINDLGKYDTCLRGDQDGKLNNTNKNLYAVIKTYPIKTIYPISYVGVCLPNECKDDDILDIGLKFYSNSTFGVYNKGDLILTKQENDDIRNIKIFDYFIISIIIIYILVALGLVTIIYNIIRKLNETNNCIINNNKNDQKEIFNQNTQINKSPPQFKDSKLGTEIIDNLNKEETFLNSNSFDNNATTKGKNNYLFF